MDEVDKNCVEGVSTDKRVKLTNPVDWDTVFLGMAEQVSQRSKDPSTKVGAVVVSPDKRSASFGYNGFPSKFPDYEDIWNLRESKGVDLNKYDAVVHAEENAICQARTDLTGWTLYCTHQPCLRCSRLIASQGISRVVFYDDTKVNMDGEFYKALEILKQCNIVVDQYHKKSSAKWCEIQNTVAEFHKAFGIAISPEPTLSDRSTQMLRMSLINEEFEELVRAYDKDNLIEVADALGDLLYVVVGAAVSHGLDIKAIFDEVHRSNMTKVDGHKGEDGKWIKPDNYSRPDLRPFV